MGALAGVLCLQVSICQSSLCTNINHSTHQRRFTGDWICQICANKIGMDSVGLEGYEFDVDNKKEKDLIDLVDSEEDNIEPAKPNNLKRLKKNHV